MLSRTEQSPYRRADRSSLTERRSASAGFSLVEVLICTLILTIGLVGIAGLLAVTTQMHIGAREAARSTRLAQDKVDELMKLNFTVDPEVAIGGSITEDLENHFESPLDGVTLRWVVADGPVDDTRVV